MAREEFEITLRVAVETGGFVTPPTRAEAQEMAYHAVEDLTRVIPVRCANYVTVAMKSSMMDREVYATRSARRYEPHSLPVCLTSCRCDGRRTAALCSSSSEFPTSGCRECN